MRLYAPDKVHYPKIINVSSAWGDIPYILLHLLETFKVKRNKCLEFGVEYGYSTSALANYFKEVIGVDTFRGDINSGIKKDHFETTKQNLKDFPNIKLIKSDYKDFIKDNDQQYDLIHVDMSHDYNETFHCGEWSIMHSNTTIFHDTESFPQVKHACEDLANKYSMEFYNYPRSNGLGILKLFMIMAVALCLCGFAAKTYKYRCPKCKLVQEYTQQGVKKCPKDGRTMIKMP